MDSVERLLTGRILNYLRAPQKAALIFGARRVGKTVLLNQVLKQYGNSALLLNGEDNDTQILLEERSAGNYRRLLAGKNVLALDEAQSIPDIGRKIKLILDEVSGINVIASGSSSFELYNKAGEPLVGRSSSFYLTPF